MSNDKIPLLSLKNVGVYYRKNRGVFGDKIWAIEDISFELYPGETLGIIGRNGAGKSTLLRTMSGIIKPNKGTFINHGNHQVSLLTLQLGFIHYLSGRENIFLSGMFLGLTKIEIREKMDAIIDFSELGDFIDRPIGTYSSGMLARLGFSIAFQVDPDVLLIDEVLGVGDEQFSQKSAEVIYEKIKSNKTVVFVSHQARLIEALCERTVWIEDRCSKVMGKTTDVLEQYHQHMLGENADKRWM